jgi:hypothetical protein
MGNSEKGLIQKIKSRLKKDGVFKAIQYIAKRQSIGIEQQLAEKEASTWNDHFFDSLGIERSDAEKLLEETRKKIPLFEEDVHVKSQKQQSTHLLVFAALKVAGFSPKSFWKLEPI